MGDPADLSPGECIVHLYWDSSSHEGEPVCLRSSHAGQTWSLEFWPAEVTLRGTGAGEFAAALAERVRDFPPGDAADLAEDFVEAWGDRVPARWLEDASRGSTPPLRAPAAA